MPEGDTIFRTATTLRRWMGSRVVTAARSQVPGLELGALVGRVLSEVTPVGKHLLMQFEAPIDSAGGEPAHLLLRTHMRMSGSWHVYSRGDRWQRPQRQARVVIEAGDRVAVCFNAPVIELTSETIATASGVSHLGPDILGNVFDPARVAQRALLDRRATGEVLLDQRLVAGIGNIYRCESLHLQRISPWTVACDLDAASMTALFARARKLMLQNLSTAALSRDLDLGIDGTWVYRRSGLPCRTCSTSILSRPQGDQARMAYWCPTCQPLTPPAPPAPPPSPRA